MFFGIYFFKIYTKDDPRLTLTYVVASSNLVPSAVEKVHVSVVIVLFYMKISTHFNPYGILGVKVIW